MAIPERASAVRVGLMTALGLSALPGCEGEVTGGATDPGSSGGVIQAVPSGGQVTTGNGGARSGGASATGGSASGGNATGGTTHANVQYAGTVVNPIDSGDEVLFRRIEDTMCVLLPAFVAAGGPIALPITAYALPPGPLGCLAATPSDSRATATQVTGTITRADGGPGFDLDLHLSFPEGQDWLASSVDFRVSGLPLDGVWHPG